jgi:hypothetical protein
MGKTSQEAIWPKCWHQVCVRWVGRIASAYSGTRLKLSRYCFGAPYVCNELAEDTVTAGAFAHPAFLKDHHFHQLQSQYPRPTEDYVLTGHRTSVFVLF